MSCRQEASAEAKYIYCVAYSGERTCLGRIGLEGREVYTIPFRDMGAVVHDCLAEPYQSTNKEVVQAWVLTHHAVVGEAWRRWGTVLPLSFDTLVPTGCEGDPKQNIVSWLQRDYEGLKQRMEKVKGKAEYGVQVLWQPSLVAPDWAEQNPEIGRLRGEIKAMPSGLAYMYEQRLRHILRGEVENRAESYFQDFYHRVKKQVDDLRVEKTSKNDQDTCILMNLSCLVSGAPKELSAELEAINQMEGFTVRFIGPWPPYSFVNH